ncbi:MAG: TIGR01244 family sulfur transferase [Hydrogenophaga sp.]|uniref:TIGR01244 family sulfur transferase n=1 Tax=Hydrogenophaga sp. TaxID=1904254 RepID=UPI002ABCDCB1|nr:TIGR01244 family sulfur transferase [Hydrogenophaga sp.]MDZ4102727.1 TIGR01244 family sulfur transferase [Hydrogenophaga sp.]
MAPLNVVPLSEALSVAGQISPADLMEIARAGFKSVICNRPDGESPGQFSYNDLVVVGSQASLTMAYLPVVSGRVTEEEGRAFGDLLNQMPTPVLAYCRSGLRSATLWALSQAGSQAWPDLLQRAAQAGYNLSGVASPTRPPSV